MSYDPTRKRQKRSGGGKKSDSLGYNERKILILELLKEEDLTPQEVAEEMEIDGGAARSLLRRYQLNNLVKREESMDHNPGKGRNPYVYSLSKQGKENLEEDRIEVKPSE